MKLINAIELDRNSGAVEGPAVRHSPKQLSPQRKPPLSVARKLFLGTSRGRIKTAGGVILLKMAPVPFRKPAALVN